MDRRQLLLAAVSSLTAGSAGAQPAESETHVQAAALDVLPNLVTRMAVPARINGSTPYRFAVDTGASHTSVSEELAQALRLPAGPDVLVNGVTAAVRTSTVTIARIEVGGAGSFHDILAPVFPQQRLGVDGLLGVDILGRFAVTFNVAHNVLDLRRRSLGLSFVRGTRLDTTSVLSARQRFGQLNLIDVSADGVPVQAIIDSGSQYSIGNQALYDTVAIRRPDIRDHQWAVPIIGTTGDAVTGRLAVLQNLRLGPVRFPSLPVIFCDLHIFDLWQLSDRPALVFGADILQLFESVTIDFPEREIRFGDPRRPENSGVG